MGQLLDKKGKTQAKITIVGITCRVYTQIQKKYSKNKSISNEMSTTLNSNSNVIQNE